MADQKSPLEVAYFAGFFDGEGMVAIYDKSSSYRIVLANTDVRPLKRAKELWGGHLYCQSRDTTKFALQDLWRWQLCGQEAGGFLEDIRPYLMLKAEQADVFLEVLQHLPNGRGERRGPGATDAIQAADRRLRLLKRGVA